jgi:hypothetical protein
MYQENKNITPITLLKEAMTLQDFRNMLEKYKLQIQEISAMETSLQVEGILLVDTQDLKDLFLPSPSSCIQSISQALPDLAKHKTQKLSDEVAVDSRRLSSTTRTVDEYVEYLACVRGISAKTDKMEEEYVEIEDMYEMMAENSVHVSDEDRMLFQGLHPALLHLRADVDHALSHKHESIHYLHSYISRYFDLLKN